MNIKTIASEFFDACETGQGWDVCKAWCHQEAGFSAQASALSDVTTLSAYCEWMKGLLVPIPNGNYELKAMAVDDERQIVLAFGVFKGTHTVDGPVPATGNCVSSEYIYAMEFDGEKIRNVTKIWNDSYALQALGWV